jgi:oxygen-independent coproporphyrinogen-3 oxidase
VKLSEHSGRGQATVTTEGRWLIRTIAAVLDPAQRQRASGSRLV